ncbi:MAG: glycosyltransferase family 2 protein [bacterium]|nr:glycosyltransferase family 2 protein [bacterium]
MKKLIIQIPCYNEEKTLPITLRAIPRSIRGVDKVEILIIDDGSTDRTVAVARENGADHIVKLTNNKGLAEGFLTGLDACLRLDADIIVNTDGDNQYNGADIEKLIEPIVKGKADIVVGNRQVDNIEHFSLLKKKLQHLGSWVVRQVSGTDIPDTTSGFRAFSRDAALKLNVVSKFSYTLETIIQAGKKNIAITHVPVGTNSKMRESRLFKSTYSYIKRSLATIIRIYTMYEPIKTFFLIGGLIFSGGLILSLRYLYFYLFTPFGGQGHIQSVILAAVLFIVGFQVMVIGLLSDVIAANRRLLEDTLYRVKKLELNGNKNASGN